MDDDQAIKKYSLSMEHAIVLLTETKDQISVLKGLFLHFSSDPLDADRCFFPLISELLWYNYSIARILNSEIEDPVWDDENKDIIVLEKTMMGLQTLLLSRYYATSELNKFSCSTSLN